MVSKPTLEERKGEKRKKKGREEKKGGKRGGKRRRRKFREVIKQSMIVNIFIFYDEFNDTDISRHRGAEGADPPS